ncbi:hypothetical protein N0V82_005237 [Gnomoniopsis sp. IMI 355080]|nr:hypothetical protein N0V82_005237 [Gnomoniopsis sp. IMI 355080]
MSSSRGHRNSVYYKDDSVSSGDDSIHHQKSSRPRGYRPHVYREDSLIKRPEPEIDKADGGGDTSDYSPKDKYYLSEDDDPHGLYSPRGSSPHKKSRAGDDHSRERRSSSKHYTTDRDHSRRSPSPPRSRSHRHHHRRRSPSHSHQRDNDEDDLVKKHKSSTPAPRSRPKPSRAGSSYLASSRPRPSRARSSYATSRSSRPRPVRGLSHNSSKIKPKTKFPHDLSKLMDPDTFKDLMQNFPWDEAGKVALQAGTVAAIKVGTDDIPWAVKATKIGSAALGAAVVDHVFKPQKKGGVKYAAMRHLAEVAVGNLVVGPTMRKAGSKGGGGRRR